jgi:hypothetical protein
MACVRPILRTIGPRTRAILASALLLSMCVCMNSRGAPSLQDPPLADSPIRQRVVEDLAAYYAACAAESNARDIIPYREMVSRLSNAAPEQRQEAGQYLYALCLQTQEDDNAGRTPKPRGMKLRGGPNECGAELRGWMANRLADAEFFEYPVYLYDMSTGQRAAVYSDMKLWLASQFKSVQDGKPTDVIKEDLVLPWGEWRMDSSGWVQRL